MATTLEQSYAISLWKQGEGEEKKARTQGSSGKFHINLYKLDSIRMWLFGSKSLSLGAETSTWLSHHSFLRVGPVREVLTGEYDLFTYQA